MKIYPYNPGSKSAAALAEALGIERIKTEGKPIFIKKCLINWGSTRLPLRIAGVDENARGLPNILNVPTAVAKASNKLEAFKAMAEAEVSKPICTTDRATAEAWSGDGLAVVCRTKLNGHSGEGIVIADVLDEIVDAPLYTQYIKKKEEYRIHVFQGKVFFAQRKARKVEVPDDQVNWKVRNLAGGFIFANKDVEVAEEAKAESIKAVACLGLDFGAVDVILGTDKKWYVLEVNTACGLEGTTLEKYVEQFQAFK